MSDASGADTLASQVPLVVGVTAHRDLVESEVEAIRERVRDFLTELGSDFPDLPLAVMCPLSEGGDRLVAKEAVALGLPLIVPLPMPKDLYAQDFETAESRREFDELLEYATVAELPLVKGCTLDSIAVDGHARNLQYAQVGVFLSAHCHILLAIWDGKPSDRLGGTAQVVRYHHETEMEGFTDGILEADQLLAQAENDVVYHIVASRDRPGGSPEEGLEPLETHWYVSDPESPRNSDLPLEYVRVFEAMSEFNRDAASQQPHIERSPYGLGHGEGRWTDHPTLRRFEDLFRRADWLASYFQRRVSAALLLSYSLAVLMGLAFIMYTDVPGQRTMLYAFLTFFAIGFGLYVFAERGDWHRKYLDYRGLAEGLRVQFYWSAAGVSSGEQARFAHDNFLQKQDVELGWIRNIMRFASLFADLFPYKDDGQGLDLALREWIGDSEGDGVNDGQIRYYRRQISERTKRHQRTERLALVSLWTGIGLAVILAGFEAQLGAGYRDPLVMLMGILPMIAAAREAYANKKAEKELIKQYRFMHGIFENARRRIEAARSPSEQRAILRALGDAALDEHAEWILLHRERPLDHGKL